MPNWIINSDHVTYIDYIYVIAQTWLNIFVYYYQYRESEREWIGWRSGVLCVISNLIFSCTVTCLFFPVSIQFNATSIQLKY